MPSQTAPKHPRGLYALFFTEMWERFGFYTMSGIFTLYASASRGNGGLGLPERRATYLYGIFGGAAYFAPMFGGAVADGLRGERWPITLGGLLLGLGYLVLALPPGQGLWMLYLAIATIAAGNGLFKPNISTLVGKLYPSDSPLRDAGFNLFYTGINLGAVAAPLVASLLRTMWSWQAAFGAASAGMGLSFLIFWLSRRTYASALVPATRTAGEMASDADDPVGFGRRVTALAILYLVSIIFWSLFFQNGAALTLWAKNCTSRPDWLKPEIFLVVNPACIVLLSSAAAWLWRWLGQRDREPSTPNKILLGLVAAMVACLVMVAASLAGGDGCAADGKGTLVSMGWLVLMYVTISLAEILFSPMGLSYCTRVAPRRLGGLVMGLWFVSLSVGHYLSGLMSSRLWDVLPHSTYFGILAGCMLGVSVLLFLVRGTLEAAAS